MVHKPCAYLTIGFALCVILFAPPLLAQENEPQLERVLLPIFTPPSAGANGSEFHVEFRAANTGETGEARLYGDLAWLTCSPWGGFPCDEAGYIILAPRQELSPAFFHFAGRPGAFVYVTAEDAKRVAMNLRVYDVSRDAENFGTEIPIVREHDWFINEPLVLLGVPTDPRFRNTLRVYSMGSATFTLHLESESGYAETREIVAGETYFWPYVMGYAQISDLPVGIGRLRVTIEPHEPSREFWAFDSVTNNDTQHITVISPQR